MLEFRVVSAFSVDFGAGQEVPGHAGALLDVVVPVGAAFTLFRV